MAIFPGKPGSASSPLGRSPPPVPEENRRGLAEDVFHASSLTSANFPKNILPTQMFGK